MPMMDTMSQLDPTSSEPLWQQAARAIQRELSAGKLGQGGRLPPERELLGELGVSRVTLRRALQSLVDDGVLVSSHGRGWYVAETQQQEFPQTLESFSETAERLGLISSSVVLRAARAPATFDQAEEFGVAPGAALFHLERIRQLDGVPLALDVSYFAAPPDMNLDNVDFRSASLFRVLFDAGWDLARADVTVEAQTADEKLAGLLQIEPGNPVLIMRQKIVDGRGHPRISSVVTYAGDRYRLRTAFPRIARPAPKFEEG